VKRDPSILLRVVQFGLDVVERLVAQRQWADALAYARATRDLIDQAERAARREAKTLKPLPLRCAKEDAA